MKFTKYFILFTTVFIIICILASCIILACSSWSDKLPKAPTLSTSSTMTEQDAVAKQITNYKELLMAQQQQRTNVFESVNKALSTLFTAIIAAVLSYVIPKAVLAAFSIRKNGVIEADT